MENFQEKACALTLNRVFGFKPRISREIVDTFGSASAVFALDRESLNSLFGPYGGLQNCICGRELDESCRELERLQTSGCGFIAFSEQAYPALLRECPDPPAGLYYRSSSPPEKCFGNPLPIAVVGTRDISPYGREWCSRIVGNMAGASSKPSITSGFAIGTDITAHLAALDNGLQTVAVLPTGIDDIYPPSHRRIADRLALTPGCALVTDYPPGTSVQKLNFLRRNRLIAGMSASTLVIESKRRGGAMMTARLAQEYGRNVFALPGRIEDPRSAGCNLLIREKIAEPVIDIAGLTEQFGLVGLNHRREDSPLPRAAEMYANDPDRDGLTAVLDCIAHRRGITPEELCHQTCLHYGDAVRRISRLENDGFIRTDLLQRCFIVTKFA